MSLQNPAGVGLPWHLCLLCMSIQTSDTNKLDMPPLSKLALQWYSCRLMFTLTLLSDKSSMPAGIWRNPSARACV